MSAKRHIERAFLCNLLEEEDEELPVIGNCVSINFKPYEIHTIKLYME
ncbi:glycosyl hydrolase-related protein [Enterococcus durans]|nr:glycosyl hydrolase-related protein [Enterococcus durans]